tara:strand:+ start:68 stop:787 length:720 start_codon:yes stop_codon:yes gene_type:complete
MMFKFKILLVVIFSLSVISNESAIKEKISMILPPDTTIESIEKSPIEGIYKVYFGDLQPLYVSQEGNFFIYGDMFKIDKSNIINITNLDMQNKRLNLIKGIYPKDLIAFNAEEEAHNVIVFTDVDCGYCQKLHSQISQYNELGISIKYAAFPRSGIGGETFNKMVGAWCSDDPKKTITELKEGKKLKPNFCNSQPVAKHYAIGNKLGISGTPALILENGELIPGYQSPQDLLKKLEQQL